jgi:hypothetical protein
MKMIKQTLIDGKPLFLPIVIMPSFLSTILSTILVGELLPWWIYISIPITLFSVWFITGLITNFCRK